MKIAMLGSPGEHLLPRIAVQKLFTAVASQHAHQGVIDFNESAVGTAEKEPFLNVVEQFPVSTLGFTPVRNVLQDMNCLQAFTARGVDLRG